MIESLSIEEQFELTQKEVKSGLRERVSRFAWRVISSFRFVRFSVWLVFVFVWAILFYGVENNYNPIYSVGRNLTLAANGTTVSPATGIPSGLDFVDALFNSVSFFSSTGLSVVDYSLWSFPSQLIGLFGMMIASLLINTTIPLAVRIINARRVNGSEVYRRPEFQGLVMVLVMVYVYFLFFCVFMATMFAIYCAVSPIRVVFETASPPIDPWFGGYFLAFSSFANCGFSPFGSSVVPFVTNPGFLVWLMVFMLTGNIAFPTVLRGTLSLMDALGLERRWGLPISLVKGNPRAFYQMMFPVRYIFFLSILWVVLYVINFSLILGLEWNNTMTGLDPGQKVVGLSELFIFPLFLTVHFSCCVQFRHE
jgi:Trk-type K+ transport system membrane component